MPPVDFNAIVQVLPVGQVLYRTHSSVRDGNEFNPGFGARTRFAFFGTPIVPVLYTAATEDTALCESILHAVPRLGGSISDADYAGKMCSRLIVRRELRLASLVGLGERALNIRAEEVCGTDAAFYPETVQWAEAAHAAGFDGLAYPSSKAIGREAHVLFGDRVSPSDLEVDAGYLWSFDDPDGEDKLRALCRSINVTVLIT